MQSDSTLTSRRCSTLYEESRTSTRTIHEGLVVYQDKRVIDDVFEKGGIESRTMVCAFSDLHDLVVLLTRMYIY